MRVDADWGQQMEQLAATRRNFIVQAGTIGALAAAPALASTPIDPMLALPGRSIVGLIAARKVSCEEVMRAVLTRIAAVNPAHNAVVALRDDDVLLGEARALDNRLAGGEKPELLFGLPWAVKDLQPVVGIRSTSGSLV